MDQGAAAIGREAGKVDTDAAGLARYSLKLVAPPGICNGTEPELSLEYSQGAPNGSVGAGWALGGLSAIRRAPTIRPWDQFNNASTLPLGSGYDTTTPKLILDGAEMLNVRGEYHGDDAQYSTEVESVRRIITARGPGNGFVTRDATGHSAEYGTTGDSRVLYADDEGPLRGQVREWRLKRAVDYHGNAITYHYTSDPTPNPNPQPGDARINANACYISRIQYTSNEHTGHVGTRVVDFEYSLRDDVVVQTVQGDRCSWASLLKAVRFGIVDNSQTMAAAQVHRSYELKHAASPATGDSCLVQVTEVAAGKETVLLPTSFEYTLQGAGGDSRFQQAAQLSLDGSQNAVALFPMNISGRAVADLACVQYDVGVNRLTLKTYLADPQNGTWQPHAGAASEVELPQIDRRDGFPGILAPDWNNDGRADLVIPFRDDDMLSFSLSKCVGVGFQQMPVKKTDCVWIKNSKFIAVDFTGRGNAEIVQIFEDPSNNYNITFRTFAAAGSTRDLALSDGIVSTTSYSNTGTIDWCQVNSTRTGAKCLVRVWTEDRGGGLSQFKATTFVSSTRSDQGTQLVELKTVDLGEAVPQTTSTIRVLPCDINADGAQDIVLAWAEYQVSAMVLSLTTYLDDGDGGFVLCGKEVRFLVDTPPPAAPDTTGEAVDSAGTFYATNLNGSNYPTLSYVYQEASSNDFRCLSVDGRSNGSFGTVESCILAKDLPNTSLNVMATDLNGNGMGDWLIYGLKTTDPTIVPVYNRASVVGLLAKVQSPMGLCTSLSYGCLSDPEVYTPAVDWSVYSNDINNDLSFPLIGAPNFVVTQLEHRNNPAVNCIGYKVRIKKTYRNGRVNTCGRGWQGFEQIDSLNTSDGIWMSEKYHQQWPLSSSKYQVDTRTLDGQILQSQKITHDVVHSSMGPWKVYRTNKTQERIDMLENGQVVRSNGTDYHYDEHGNMVLRSPWELQGNKEVFRSFERCSYITMDDLTGVLTASKLSTREANVDLSKFEPGDCTLKLYNNEMQTLNDPLRQTNWTKSVLTEMLEWSTELSDFSKTSFKFSPYGQIVEVIDPAGLTRTTTYDDVFHTFAVKITYKGLGVDLVELAAFDLATGVEVVKKDRKGRLLYHQVDGFGRVREIRSATDMYDSGMISSEEFLKGRPFVGDAALKQMLAGTQLSPQQTVDYERETSPNGSCYLLTRVTRVANQGAGGKHELCEYLDCVGQARKRSSRNGGETIKTWQTFDFNNQGAKIFESFPKSGADLDWQPERSFGTSTTFDTLGRSTRISRPAHGEDKGFLVTANSYSGGGASVEESRYFANSADEALVSGATPLLHTLRSFIRPDGQKELLVKSVQGGSTTEFAYDASGNLVLCREPDGHEEHHVRNSQGQVVERKTRQHTLKFYHDIKQQMFKKEYAEFSNATTYRRDCLGRVLQQSGSEGRTVQYSYDRGGVENVASITVFPNGPDKHYESRLEFEYDVCGRIAVRKLTLADGHQYITQTSYDWQDRLVQKIQPDGVIVQYDFLGAKAKGTILSGGASSTWTLKSETLAYNPLGRPTKMLISGTGIKEAFTHDWEYDPQGFPLLHRLSSGDKTLTQEHYVYNALDQMSRKHDMITGSTTDYLYEGLRLASSQVGNGALNSYSYDTTGNLVSKAGTEIKYSDASKQVTGSRNGAFVFDVTYDTIGRVTQRRTADGDFTFTYNSLGALQSLDNADGKTRISIVTDHNGETLYRQHAQGSSDLYVSQDFSVHLQPDGTRTSLHQLKDNTVYHLATVSLQYESAMSTRPLSGGRSFKVHFADTKGTIASTFRGEDAVLLEKFEYDDFGMLADDARLDDDGHATYEGKPWEKSTGLLDFRSRCYDPLMGRFTTPDDIDEVKWLSKVDGMNRYAFENNDPINHVDPTGHWSWSSVLGVVLGVTLVVAAIAVTVLTGGAAAPLAAAAVGALMSGGIAGIMYSVKHQDEKDARKFW